MQSFQCTLCLKTFKTSQNCKLYDSAWDHYILERSDWNVILLYCMLFSQWVLLNSSQYDERSNCVMAQAYRSKSIHWWHGRSHKIVECTALLFCTLKGVEEWISFISPEFVLQSETLLLSSKEPMWNSPICSKTLFTHWWDGLAGFRLLVHIGLHDTTGARPTDQLVPRTFD